MTKKMPSSYSILKQRLEELAQLGAVMALLNWDQEVHMPVKGSEPRSKAVGYVASLMHERVLALDDGGALRGSERRFRRRPESKEAAVVRETKRVYLREKKLPARFVRELSEHASIAQVAWANARKKNDFGLFLPHLKKMIALKRREAAYVGFKDSPYDALLDTYEPGLTTRSVAELFDGLRSALIRLLKRIESSSVRLPSPTRFIGRFPLEKQREFNVFIAKKMGFDFDAGRFDISTHPFTTNFHPQDVRFTTRYREDDVLDAIGSTIHETGHALYEQGLPSEHFGTPLAEAVSMGVHESQSRVWENVIGKSRAFWTTLYPALQAAFPKPYAKILFEDFYCHLNRVTPSLIRTESDEVTYNLHILVRFEMERALIEGSLSVEDAPREWNKKMHAMLGVRVPDDRRGILQDVHWSCGYFGYFPTYTLGNLYASQFYHQAMKEIPSLEREIAKGHFYVIREWLRNKIHIHGKYFTADALVKKVTGEPLTSNYFLEYLEKKYGEIYFK